MMDEQIIDKDVEEEQEGRGEKRNGNVNGDRRERRSEEVLGN